MITYEDRKDIPETLKWSIEDIYEDDRAWESDFSKIDGLVEAVVSFAGRIAESAETLFDLLKAEETLERLISKLFLYARMHSDENTKDSHYQGLTTRIQSKSVKVNEAIAFITPEIMASDEAVLMGFVASHQDLNAYHHKLESLLKDKPHVLSEAEEKLLAMVGDMSGTPQRVFGMLNNADLQFPEVEKEDGSKVRLTHGNYVPLMESKDRRVRKDAFDALYATYEQHKHSLAAMLEGEVRKNIFYSKARKHADARSASLSRNHIDPAIYDGLIQGVHENLKPLHDYVALRADVMGSKVLEPYDLYLPLVSEVDESYSFEDAFEIVMKAIEPLGEEYVSVARRSLEERWYDVCENTGKRSGAYSWGTYDTKPYILLNHHGTLDNMFTLAHELGHSMHSHLTRSNQPYQYGDYSIFLAEVASTTNEALLTEYLLKIEKNPAKRAYIINHMIDQFRTTLYRQTLFAEFELAIHRIVEGGEGLTSDVLTKVYGDLHTRYYGENFNNDSAISLEWSRIPHFYYNFYVFQYATGFSAAMALSKRILTEGSPAVQDYLGFLKAGCSNYPVDVLRAAGADMTDPATVGNALSVFADKVNELKTLLAQL